MRINMKYYLYGLLMVSLTLNPVVSVFAAYATGQNNIACTHMKQTGDIADLSACGLSTYGLSGHSSYGVDPCCQQADECGGKCTSCNACHLGGAALSNTASQYFSSPVLLLFKQYFQLNGKYQQANFRPPRFTS